MEWWRWCEQLEMMIEEWRHVFVVKDFIVIVVTEMGCVWLYKVDWMVWCGGRWDYDGRKGGDWRGAWLLLWTNKNKLDSKFRLDHTPYHTIAQLIWFHYMWCMVFPLFTTTFTFLWHLSGASPQNISLFFSYFKRINKIVNIFVVENHRLLLQLLI